MLDCKYYSISIAGTLEELKKKDLLNFPMLDPVIAIPHLHNAESPLPKNHLSQVWFHLVEQL